HPASAALYTLSLHDALPICDATKAAKFGRIVAVCDVDDGRLAEARKLWPDAEVSRDFRRVVERKDIAVVVCGTVDHWHTLVSLRSEEHTSELQSLAYLVCRL